MMQQLFNTLIKVDSTNNYAMGKVHEGLAKHGMAWFANEQITGKGQRGKTWESEPGENIILSVVVQPPSLFEVSKFYFNALVALTLRNFIQKLCPDPVFIKWPNDIYIGDKKAGGILIENIINSTSWKWSVIGIGININQEEFREELNNAISIYQITNKKLDVITCAKELQSKLVYEIDSFGKDYEPDILNLYNSFLYKRNMCTILKDRTGVFSAIIRSVDENGNIIVETNKVISYKFGEIQWINETLI